METFLSSFDNKILVRLRLLSTYYVFCARSWKSLGRQGIPVCSTGEGCLLHKQPKGASKCQE